MDEQVKAHLRISGRVQGVCYRLETKHAAEKWGAYGWVKNRPDGTVEAVVEGSRQAVEALIAWCKSGPALARVDEVAVTWMPHGGEFQSFEITY